MIFQTETNWHGDGHNEIVRLVIGYSVGETRKPSVDYITAKSATFFDADGLPLQVKACHEYLDAAERECPAYIAFHAAAADWRGRVSAERLREKISSDSEPEDVPVRF
jgi:hypothetical protein